MVFVLLPVFSFIPMSCIAALLVVSSMRLVPKTVMIQLWKLDKAEFCILLITTAFCVLMDGALGLLIGCMVCLLRNAVAMRNKEGKGGRVKEGLVKVTSSESTFQGGSTMLTINVSGPFNYITAYDAESDILKIVEKAIKEKSAEYVVVDLTEVVLLDADAIESLFVILKRQNKIRIALNCADTD